MDQYNNSKNEFLWKLLANPADDAHLYADDLQRLVNDFPQSGVLHALLAHASDDKNLRQASVYFNARSLYKLINAPSTFIGVPGERIIIENSIGANGHYKYAGPPASESLHSFHEENIESNIDEAYSNNITTFEETKEEFEGHIPALHEEAPVATAEQHLTETVHRATDNEAIEKPVENKAEEAYETLLPPVVTVHENEESEAIAETIDHQAEETHDATPPPVEGTGYQTNEHEAIQEPVEHEIEETKEATLQPVETAYQTNEHEAIQAPVEHEIEEIHEATPQPIETGYQTNEHEAIQEPGEHKAEETHEATPPPIETAYQTSEHETVKEPVEHTAEEAHEAMPPAIEIAYQTNEREAVQEQVEHEAEETHETIAPAKENIPVDNLQEETHETAPRYMPAVPQEHEAVNNDPVAVEHPVEARHEETEEEQKAPAVETPEEQPGQQIADDEVFDEIVSIEQINLDAKNPQAAGKTYADEEALINGGIASSDFFMFDKTFGEHKQTGQEETPPPVEAKGQTGADAEHQDVSKYHDEKMPYTFMWWLDKTRKEHAATYQPYIKQGSAIVAANRPKKPADELQQQYFENIFHITSVEELDKSTPPPAAPYAVKPKEHTIIERFIKEEPQIRPQSSEKIDNENKAKKSSEDRDELVTETLAAIYSDQMLYHKAIASYKKLMLKFPEKSRYFAGKIEQLEKKTN